MVSGGTRRRRAAWDWQTVFSAPRNLDGKLLSAGNAGDDGKTADGLAIRFSVLFRGFVGATPPRAVRPGTGGKVGVGALCVAEIVVESSTSVREVH
jgi:hypothetical protein